jgi:hypothetical protein
MKPHIKLEKRAYFAWGRNLLPGTPSRYEKQFESSLSRVVAVRTTNRELLRAVKSNDVIVFGDDLLVPQHQLRMLKVLQGLQLPSKTLFLTHRAKIPHPLRSWLSREKIRVRTTRFSPGSMKGEDAALARLIEAESIRNTKIVVWTGALRLAPSHLPKQLGAIQRRCVFVLMHAPQVRWRLDGSSEWARMGRSHFCWVNVSPLLSLEYRRAFHSRVTLLLRPEELERKFSQYCSAIVRRTVAPWPHPVRFLWTAFALEKWKRPYPKFLVDRLMRGESAVVPKDRTVLLSSLQAGHVAEEAAHYVRLSRTHNPKADAFSVAREEALAFMASLWIDPQRKVPARPKKQTPWAKVHWEGYRTGKELYRKQREGKITMNDLRAVWRQG